MKKIIFAAAAALMLVSCSQDKGKVTINLPKDFKDSTLVVSHSTIANMFNATQAEDFKIIYDTLEVKNGVATLTLDPAGPSRYNIEPPVLTTMQPEFYASPDDALTVTISNFEPLSYTVTGSELMEDLTEFDAITMPIQQEYVDLINRSENISIEQAQAARDRYDAAVKKFVADHPKSPAVPLAIITLSGDDFKQLYDNMTPEARKSIVIPYADQYNLEVVEMQQERVADLTLEEEKAAKLATGTVVAPDFTLPDLNGKKVSLSDFKGKWVVLDFWGSWCGWCIEGFPDLKDAYKQYGDKITVIGIDCNDSDAAWRDAVKKYDLPWLQLYNGHNEEIYKAYDIEGFPTKAIINPEGKLVDLTVGEDSTFFTRLAGFVK